MTLLPLFPTHSSDVYGPFKAGTCRFCGSLAPGWMRRTEVVGEVVPCCLLCSLCRGLDRPRIADEATLIWLPEMTQRALMAVVRRLHLICYQHGQAPTMTGVPPAGTPLMSQAWGLNLALKRRSALAGARLGTTDLSELDEALDDATRAGASLPAMLGGLRVLPLGRFFNAADEDIYPQALAAIAKAKATSGVAA